MATQDVRYVVSVEDAGALKKLQDLGLAMRQIETESSSAISSFGKMAASWAAGYLSVQMLQRGLGLLKNALVDSIEGAIEEEKSQHGLQAALEATGRTVRGNIDHYEQFAKAQMRVTLFTDEQIRSAQKLALTMSNLDQKGIDQVIKGAMGLSQVFGLDLEQATRAVSLGFAGNYRAIGQYIPAVRQATTESEKHAALVREMGKMYSQATAAVDTFGGRVSQFKKYIGEIQENIGGAIIQTQTFNVALTALNVIAEKWMKSGGRGPIGYAINQVLGPVTNLITVLAIEEAKAAKAAEDQAKATAEAEKSLVPFYKTLQNANAELGQFGVGLFYTKGLFEASVPAINQVGNGIKSAEQALAEYILLVRSNRQALIETPISELTETGIPDPNNRLQNTLDKRWAFWGNLYQMDKAAYEQTLNEEQRFTSEFMQDLTLGFAGAFMQFRLSLQGFKDFFVAVMVEIKNAFVKALAEMMAQWVMASLVLPFLRLVFSALAGPFFPVAAGATGAIGFQTGFHGVISKPTLAVIGEAGPERVDISPTRGGGSAGGGVVNNWYISAIDGADVERVVRQRIVPVLKEVYAHGGL